MRRQQSGLARIDPGHGAARALGQLRELGGIDIHHVHRHRHARRGIGRHLPRKHIGRRDRVGTHYVRDGRRHPAIGKGGQRQGPPARQRLQPRARARLGAWHDAATRQPRRQRGRHHPVGRIVGKGAQMHPRQRRQMRQDMEAADLVPAVGRKRRPVRQEQQVLHCLNRAPWKSRARRDWPAITAGASTSPPSGHIWGSAGSPRAPRPRAGWHSAAAGCRTPNSS